MIFYFISPLVLDKLDVLSDLVIVGDPRFAIVLERKRDCCTRSHTRAPFCGWGKQAYPCPSPEAEMECYPTVRHSSWEMKPLPSRAEHSVCLVSLFWPAPAFWSRSDPGAQWEIFKHAARKCEFSLRGPILNFKWDLKVHRVRRSRRETNTKGTKCAFCSACSGPACF